MSVMAEMTATALDWVDACAMSDLVPQLGACVLIENQQVALFYLPSTESGDASSGLEATLFAIGNRDPIGGAQVLSRGIVGDVGGEPVVASPLYKERFCLRTGQCLDNDHVAVPVYPVRLVGDRIQISLRTNGHGRLGESP